jgi:hypothetical protein
MLAAVEERSVRRFSIVTASRRLAPSTPKPQVPLPGAGRLFAARRFRLTRAIQAVHDQINDAQNQRQSDQALRWHTVRELRDVIGN